MVLVHNFLRHNKIPQSGKEIILATGNYKTFHLNILVILTFYRFPKGKCWSHLNNLQLLENLAQMTY